MWRWLASKPGSNLGKAGVKSCLLPPAAATARLIMGQDINFEPRRAIRRLTRETDRFNSTAMVDMLIPLSK